jgi:hypothetical protein
MDRESLRPIVAEVVAEVLEKTNVAQSALGNRLMLSESEAAELLGVEKHVLRDARLRGEIHGRLVGKRIFYSRAALLAFSEATGQ